MRRLTWPVLAIAAVACGSALRPSEPDAQGFIPLLVTNGGIDPARRDPVEITAVRVTADTLFVSVRYGGDCRSHEFLLAASSAFAESFPVQAFLQLVHDGNGDNCKALVSRELKADLSPLRNTYQSVYRVEHGSISLNLERFAGATLYTF